MLLTSVKMMLRPPQKKIKKVVFLVHLTNYLNYKLQYVFLSFKSVWIVFMNGIEMLYIWNGPVI